VRSMLDGPACEEQADHVVGKHDRYFPNFAFGVVRILNASRTRAGISPRAHFPQIQPRTLWAMDQRGGSCPAGGVACRSKAASERLPVWGIASVSNLPHL